MKIVNLFTIFILLSEMLFQVLKIRVNLTNCSSYKDQNNCIGNKCNWISQTKTCTAINLSIIQKVNFDTKNFTKSNPSTIKAKDGLKNRAISWARKENAAGSVHKPKVIVAYPIKASRPILTFTIGKKTN